MTTPAKPTLDDFDNVELRALSAVAAQLDYIRRIDRLLDQVNELLNLYQPRGPARSGLSAGSAPRPA